MDTAFPVASCCTDFGTRYYISSDIADTKKSPMKFNHAPVVVCIHGIGGCSDQFRILIKRLELKGYTVIAYDLIGRGRSSFPEDNIFNDAAHIDQLHNLLSYVNDKHFRSFPVKPKYSLICHSMGGAIGALYTLKYPSQISSLILLSPAGLMDSTVFKILRNSPNFLKRYVRDTVLLPSQEKAWRLDFMSDTEERKAIANRVVKELKSVHDDNHQAFEAFFQSVLQFPLFGLKERLKNLSEVSCPIQLLWGKKDTVVPYGPNFQKWKKIVMKNRQIGNMLDICEYEGLGHGFFIEGEEEVAADIIRFLNPMIAAMEEEHAKREKEVVSIIHMDGREKL